MSDLDKLDNTIEKIAKSRQSRLELQEVESDEDSEVETEGSVGARPLVPSVSHSELRPSNTLLGFGIGALAVGGGSMMAGVMLRAMSRPIRHAADKNAVGSSLESIEKRYENLVRSPVAFIAIGTGVFLTGVALTAWGAVQKRKIESTRAGRGVGRITLVPRIGRDGAGLVLRGRF